MVGIVERFDRLGRNLRDEAGLKSPRADRIDHMLFTLSGNVPTHRRRGISRPPGPSSCWITARYVNRID